MAIVETVELIASQVWPQGDARDPLGIWGMREILVGDASGGSAKVIVSTPTGQDAAYVYSCLGVTIAILDVLQVVSTFLKSRILTNWPNVDLSPGINGFATLRIDGVSGDATFSDPVAGSGTGGGSIYEPNDRYLLMYDPRPTAGALNIMELEISDQVLATNYAFEVYGIFWDRSVMNTPGGPRHP